MSWDADFLELMSSRCTHTATASHDGFGKPVPGTVTANVSCHVTYATKIVRGDTEESAVSTAQIECPPRGYVVGAVTTPTIGVDDHITLADLVDRRVLSITSYTDETGNYHQSAMLT